MRRERPTSWSARPGEQGPFRIEHREVQNQGEIWGRATIIGKYIFTAPFLGKARHGVQLVPLSGTRAQPAGPCTRVLAALIPSLIPTTPFPAAHIRRPSVEVPNGIKQQVAAASTMDDSPFTQPPAVPSHSTTHARLHPRDFPPDRHTHYRGAEDSRRLSPLLAPGVDSAGSASLFDGPGFDIFPVSYTGPPSGTVVSAAAIPRGFSGMEPTPAREPQHSQQQPLEETQFMSQHQAHEGRRPSPGAAPSTNPALPPLGQFGKLPPSPAGNHVVDEVPRIGSADLTRTSSASDSPSLGPARSGRPPVNVVENPPNLGTMRQRLFDLHEPVILTKEE